MKRVIHRITQSHLNRLRWLLLLSCGHEVWVTWKTQPHIGRKADCETCAKEPAQA